MWYLISAAQLEQWLDQGRTLYLIDMRRREDFERGHIRGAVSLPGDGWRMKKNEFPRDRVIVVYCYHGGSSLQAARQLAQMGYEAADLYGGILSYRGKYMVCSR